MNGLRKLGSVLVASALTATLGVVGAGTAVAAESILTPNTTNKVDGYAATGSAVGIQAVDSKGDPAAVGSSTKLRMVAVGAYKSVTYEGTTITNYELKSVSSTSSAVVKVGKQAGLGRNASDILAALTTEENWTLFIEAAQKLGASSTFGSNAGRLLTLRSDGSYQPYSAYGNLDTQHVAGLHIVYATDNSITPFLMYTQATNGTTTVWPYGLSSSDPFAYWKAETGEGSDTPSEASQWDVYIRVAGNGAADVVNTSGVNWASSTALDGVAITIERWDGWSDTAVTGHGTDSGWARFSGAHWKLDTFVNRQFTITAVSYASGGVVNERLQKLVGVKFWTDEQDNTVGGYMQAGKAPQDYGYTTIKMFAEKRTVVPNDANGQRGGGTFTVIYSTVFETGEGPDDTPSSGASQWDVYIRVGGNGAADVVNTSGINWASSTALNGVKITIKRWDGKTWTATTGHNIDDGWARFPEASYKNDSGSRMFEITEVYYSANSMVQERLRMLIGSEFYTSEYPTYCGVTEGPQDRGYTTIKMFAEKRTLVPSDAKGQQRGSGTFTVIYSTVGLDGSSMVSSDDVFMRLAGTAETDVSTNGVTFDSSTALNGVRVMLRRDDGECFTAVTGVNGMDNGWARFVEARKDKGNFNVSYTVTEINYAADTQVNTRLQDLVGIVVNSHTNGAVDQGSGVGNQIGATSSTYAINSALKISWNGIKVLPSAASAYGVTYAGGTFTVIYSTDFTGGGDGGFADLPVTGAAGIAVLVILGLVALGGGMALRRKKAQEQA